MLVKNKKKYFKPYNKVNDKYVTIMWDYKPLTKVNAKGVEIETPLATWQEYTFSYIPSLLEIKEIITEYYNQKINEEILNGFVWNNMKIWLTSENQFNYKAAYDLAFQTNGQTLPITFKFGDNETPIYYEFKTLEELSNFYISSIKHIQNILKKGWQKKDNINWNVFK